MRLSVEEVSVDMWGGFPKVIAEVFPNAVVVFIMTDAPPNFYSEKADEISFTKPGAIRASTAKTSCTLIGGSSKS